MYSNYEAGFSGGVTIRGVPVQQSHPGQVFWVGNSGVTTATLRGEKGASDGNKGTFLEPFSTIAGAITQTTAGRGDIIFVRPGYTETISTAAGLVLSKAGVAIIGLGQGSSRPTITMSATTSTITVTASNVAMKNFLFLGTAATTFTATCFSNANAVVAKDVTIEGCEFRDAAATTGFIAIYTIGTTAAQGDGFAFIGNKVFRALTSPPAANTAVVVGAAMSRLVLSDNYIVNTTANNNVALLAAFGANAQVFAEIKGNRTQSQNTGTTAGELFSGGSTTSRGLVYGNYSAHLAATGLLAPTGTKMGFIENYCHVTGAADASALINPAAA